MAEPEADVRLVVGQRGIAQVLIDGADLTAFVSALGFDCQRGQPPRIVIEGGGRLEVAMEKVGIAYRRAPMLGPADLAALREGCDRGWENLPDLRARCEMLIDQLEAVTERATGS